MLRRLLLALLIACLAFPAAAMPMLHSGMDRESEAHHAMMAHEHHHAMPASDHDDGMAGQMHDCIGCMARYDGLALPEAPFVPAELVRCIAGPAQIAGSGPGPETPPPRC